MKKDISIVFLVCWIFIFASILFFNNLAFAKEKKTGTLIAVTQDTEKNRIPAPILVDGENVGTGKVTLELIGSKEYLLTFGELEGYSIKRPKKGKKRVRIRPDKITRAKGIYKTDSFPQKFRVKGNQIVDKSGKEAIFRGVNISSPTLLSYSFEDKATSGDYYFDQYLEWDEKIFKKISEWGANIVRLAIYPATWRVHGKDNCLRIMDQAIEWAAKHNLYVILDFHSIGYPKTEEYESNPAEGYGELYKTTKADIKKI